MFQSIPKNIQFFKIKQENQPGVCPCCKDPRETFFQSIHSDGLFRIMSTRGNFKRNSLFCETCYKWVKSVASKKGKQQTRVQYDHLSSENQSHHSPIGERSANRSTPDPFSDVMIDPLSDDPVISDVNGKRMADQPESPYNLGFREYAIFFRYNSKQ